MFPKPPLLYLAHRIPYPPNKGDKIRSFHQLKHLSSTFDVYLGTFVDDPADWQYCSAVRQYCAEALFIDRTSLLSWAPRVIAGFFSGAPLSCAYYRSGDLQHWVNDVVERAAIRKGLLFCSPMGQFVVDGSSRGRALETTVIDLVDVDSEKWKLYAENQTGVKKWLYALESRRLLAEEKRLVNAFSRSYLVSDREAETLRQRLPDLSEKIAAFDNGVDFEYFDPEIQLENPYRDGDEVLVFTGAMDYFPNIDAVTRFANTVFPAIRRMRPGAMLYIVGRNPEQSVRDLRHRDGVVVTGSVADVRPYLKYADLAVAPLRIARGVQNKVLEALSMNRTVLTTEAGFEGIDERLRAFVTIEDSKERSATAAAEILAGSPVGSSGARAILKECYRWENTLAPLKQTLIEGVLDNSHMETSCEACG